MGHLLGLGHTDVSVTAETLAAGTRRVPSFGSDLADAAVLDRDFAAGRTSERGFLDRWLGPPGSGGVPATAGSGQEGVAVPRGIPRIALLRQVVARARRTSSWPAPADRVTCPVFWSRR